MATMIISPLDALLGTMFLDCLGCNPGTMLSSGSLLSRKARGTKSTGGGCANDSLGERDQLRQRQLGEPTTNVNHFRIRLSPFRLSLFYFKSGLAATVRIPRIWRGCDPQFVLWRKLSVEGDRTARSAENSHQVLV